MVALPAEKMTDDQRARASHPAYRKIAEKIAAEYGRKVPRLADEFESQALVTLCVAARNYDPGTGVGFVPYLRERVHFAMQDLGRHWTPKGFKKGGARIAPRFRSLSAPSPGFRAYYTETLGDSLAAPSLPVGWEIESLEEVEALSRKLPPRHGEAIRLLYGHADACLIEGAAKVMGLTGGRVSRLAIEAVAMLAGNPLPPRPSWRLRKKERALAPAP